jgi:hypothetical protein
MIITATCIEDAAEFSIDNSDHKVCMDAYNAFLRDHRDHEGYAERMATAISVFKTMTITPVVKT